MKRLMFLTFLLGAMATPPVVLAASDVGSAESWQRAQDYVKQGEKAAANNDWSQARQRFLAAASCDSRNVVAMYDLGVAEAHSGNLPAAAQAERQAIEADANYAAAYVELGWILTRLGDYQAAADAEARAVGIEPGNKTAQRNLDSIQRLLMHSRPSLPNVVPVRSSDRTGVLTDKRLRPQIAADLVGCARDAYAERQQLFNYLSAGKHAYVAGEYELARQAYEQAVLLDAESSAAHAGLGVVLGSEGNIDAELVEEQRAATLDADNASVYCNIGWVQAKKQRWAEALRSYEKALSIKPSLTAARIGTGLALYNVGRKQEALECLNNAALEAPGDAQAKAALGTLLLRNGQCQEAATQLTGALSLKPGDPVVQQQLASALLGSGHPGRAADIFRQLIACTDDEADAHAGLSLALEMQGDAAGAKHEARRALDLNPRLPIVQAALARLEQKK